MKNLPQATYTRVSDCLDRLPSLKQSQDLLDPFYLQGCGALFTLSKSAALLQVCSTVSEQLSDSSEGKTVLKDRQHHLQM